MIQDVKTRKDIFDILVMKLFLLGSYNKSIVTWEQRDEAINQLIGYLIIILEIDPKEIKSIILKKKK